MAELNTKSYRRDLGSISAEHDRKFIQHFVSSPEFMRLLDDDCMIVSGTKGSGKTALMRALADIYPAKYALVHNVKLDGLKFGPLFSAVQKLNNASGQGLVGIARSTWQNVIAVFALEGLSDSKLLPKNLRNDVKKYLLKTGHLGTSTTDKFGNHLERIWRLIAKFSHENEKAEVSPLYGLFPKQQAIVGAFPSDSKLDELLRACMEVVRTSGRRLQLCFDGLDSVVEHTIESRDIVFAGLIDAAYKCATHQIFSGALSLKVLLPTELAHGARRHLRDLDKHEQHFETIHWNESNLAEFIRKRLDQHVRVKNKPFDEVWKEYFPDKIRNSTHLTDEDTYTYILRHTLYRPRQLLMHVQAIVNAWDAKDLAAPFKIDPTFIPQVVAETNYRLAEYVVNELSLDFPNLEAFLKSFRSMPCVIPWSEIPNRIERHLGIMSEKVEETFLQLYNYGIFGVSSLSATGEVKRTAIPFKFGFMTPNIERHFNVLGTRNLIALSPMFAEYCGCRSSPVGVVSPSVS